jgi:hypothetical protein
MLSAHQPYGRYPEQMKIFAREVGATAQVAGGVPAMCDGVTQGQPGMDLSLFSRDVIAMGTAIALSHGMFDAAALLGICDKIVPGLLIGALRFGHLPVLLVPGGPMPSGLPNKEKQRIRQLYAEGKVGKDELLKAESRSYHAPGTCTFYGTANSNQMMMELMGLHVPNAAFINPGTPLRQALTRAAVHRLAELARSGERSLSQVIDEKAIVNAMVGLLATGGSTNHFIHLPAIARAAGILIDWQDFAELSKAVPLITRVYPNGQNDVNDFQDAGGMAFVTYTLRGEGLIHADHLTAGADSMEAWIGNPELHGEELVWKSAEESADIDMLRPVSDPFKPDGGLRLVQGNLGRAVFKTSAVDDERWIVEAPALCFSDQNEVLERVQRCKVDVATLGFDDLVAPVLLEQRSNAKAGARTDDADHALLRKRPLGTANVAKIVVPERRDGISDCAEIVDDRVAVDPQPLLDQRGADHPGIVGQLEHVATDRPGKSDRQLVREIDSRPSSELLPGELEAAMLVGLERDWLAQRDDTPALKVGQRETGVRAPHICDSNLTSHACSASIAASMADAPASASLQCMRISANNSRPVPDGGGGELAGGRLARSTPTASSVPPWPSSRMMSPSRTRASGPSGSASGETWIAAGTLPLAPDMRPSVISATLCPRS